MPCNVGHHVCPPVAASSTVNDTWHRRLPVPWSNLSSLLFLGLPVPIFPFNFPIVTTDSNFSLLMPFLNNVSYLRLVVFSNNLSYFHLVVFSFKVYLCLVVFSNNVSYLCLVVFSVKVNYLILMRVTSCLCESMFHHILIICFNCPWCSRHSSIKATSLQLPHNFPLTSWMSTNNKQHVIFNKD